MSLSPLKLEIQDILKRTYNGELEYGKCLELIEQKVNPGPPLQWDKRVEIIKAAFLSFQDIETCRFNVDYSEGEQSQNYINFYLSEVEYDHIPKLQQIARDLTNRFGIDVWIQLSMWISPTQTKPQPRKDDDGDDEDE